MEYERRFKFLVCAPSFNPTDLDWGRLQAIVVGEPLVTYGWRLAELRRWEDSGAHWRVVSRSRAGLELSLVTCDGGEEMDRWTSEDPALLAYVADRTSDEDPR